MSSLKSSYRLGLHVTDAWSIDIADEVEVIEPFGVPPPPKIVTQEITLGTVAFNSSIGYYAAYPYHPNDLDSGDGLPLNYMPVGNTTAGTRVILGMSLAFNARVIFETLVPLISIEYLGKVYSREDYPNEFIDFNSNPFNASGYCYIGALVPNDPDHPLYPLRYPAVAAPGSVHTFTLTFK